MNHHSVLVEFFTDSGCAVVYGLLPIEGSPTNKPIVTTCTTPEQLWATLQSLKRPLAHIDLARAQKNLERAKALQVANRLDIESALRALNSAPNSEIELITNLAKAAKRRAKSNFNVDLVDLDDLKIDL